ncbi:RAMP superfamily CRISPR-associated protein [Helicobacter macacae]|uniref:CRISPR type III-associated protein domain-containing protein n=1 Tax=Helicobacter macacae MIT 99-5501 TaxID=1357400 RepID=V8C9T9_9HELI|nr:RAMP superfamily CRISPR-associated protein [Helicobacter macacae]ETD23862.1 hypothetical protein HMPREF2086_00608 [Helicobacter macacae MIT 99-5501]
MGKFYRNNYNSKPKARKAPSPYNFIKPDKRVFYPQDFGEVSDDKISFEKPFSDFQSGILEIKITAKSDIFTGAFTGKNADTQTPKDFFKIGENYALSGSSVRGVIRTIAEVLSYAKFHTNAPDYKDEKGNVTERFRSNFDKNESKLDMVERIFGIVSQNAKVQALKSRISFSHFIASEVRHATQKHIKYILMSPNIATTKGLKDKNGFRFYAPLGKITPTNAAKAKNDKVISTISPLREGSVFVGKLRYFNLTKSELGLLLLCLTALRDDKGECYKFGGAKFYGYGDAHIEIKGIDEGIKNECINAYKNLLKKANFEVESRIESLRKVSKLQSTQSTIPQNKPASYTPATRKIDDRYSQNIRDRLHQDDDDDWNGL